MKQKAVAAGGTGYNAVIGLIMLAIALVFVWRSFYAMRIPKKEAHHPGAPPTAHRQSEAVKVH
jgi:hypothetical protein